MDLSSNRSQDEDRIMQRQLYRAGQNQPAAKAHESDPARSTATKVPSVSAKAGAKSSGKSSGGGERILLMILLLGVGYYLLYGNPNQRKKAFIGLGVAGWLLLLGGISYCLCLPDPKAIAQNLRAIREDPNLTDDQKREKSREVLSNLSSGQRRQVFQASWKERVRKNNSDIYTFLQKTPEEQVAQLKKEAAEFEKRRQEWAKKRGNNPARNRKSNNNGNDKGNGNNNNNRGGGFPGGGFGGGGANGDVSRLESGSSPESRAGNLYKRSLSQQLGLNSGFGGRGGPGGGKR